MRFLAELRERARALLWRGRAERELDEELRDHVAREAAERERRGVAPADARRQALLAFGGVERTKEEVREARGIRPLEEAAADTRFALRALRRNPGFAAAVVAVLGLGIGAGAAVYRVVDALLLADLPYADGGRLVEIAERNSPTNTWALSTADAEAIEAQQRVFDAFGVVQRGEAALGGAGAPERVAVGRATAGFFAALGMRAERGRLVEPRDERPGAAAVVVVSHRLAERALGGPDAAVGRAVTLDGVSVAVIGVLPAGVTSLAGVPAAAWPALRLPAPVRRGPFWLRGVARLGPGRTVEDARADLAAVSRRLLPLYSDWHDSTALLTPIPLREALVGGAGRPVKLFALAVALVLLVAIANAATLLLVRVTARQQELWVRAALGASRRRLARLVATECVVLAGAAGAAALGVAALGLRAVPHVAPDLPLLGEVVFDARVVAFVAVAALASGVLVGLPAFVAVRSGGATPAARPEDRRSGAGRRAHALRGALVAAEFALALPLLLGAGLLLNSLLRLERVDPGFRPAGLVGIRVSLPRARYPDFAAVQAFDRRLEEQVAQAPGVVAAGLTSSLPPDNGGSTNNFNLADHPVPAGAAEPVSPWMSATASYFRTLGVPLLDGRLFTEGDSGAAPPVIVVSRSWAAHYFPRERAVGRQLVEGGCYRCPRTTIVGVVGDVKYEGISGSGEAAYDPLSQSNDRSVSLLVRSAAPPGTVFRALREAVGALDPDLPVVEATLRDRLDASLADPRRWTAVLGGFAAAAALLAALGVFGLMSFVVRQRRREMGIRLALGAEPGSLLRLVVGRGMCYAAVGTAIGVGLSAVEGRWLASLLFGVGAMDPLTTLAAVGLLLLAALAACWLPGLRAARVSPIEVLGAE
jgi:putative ABC transport system permease protein